MQAALGGEALREFERFLKVAAVLDQFRAERAHRGVLFAAVAMRHDDRRAYPGARRRIRDTLAVIAARRRDQAGYGIRCAREALGLRTKIVGVVAENAPAYALSFAEGRVVTTESADTIADGVACRVPLAEAVEVINRWAERVVTVGEAEIAAAMRYYFSDTHNVAEGAGAAPLAALLKERAATERRRVGLVLSGGNVDREVYARVLAEE